jgi:hypothetical protein
MHAKNMEEFINTTLLRQQRRSKLLIIEQYILSKCQKSYVNLDLLDLLYKYSNPEAFLPNKNSCMLLHNGQNAQVCRRLLEQSAALRNNMVLLDVSEYSPMHYAVEYKNYRMMKVLGEFASLVGCNLNIKNGVGNTPYMKVLLYYFGDINDNRFNKMYNTIYAIEGPIEESCKSDPDISRVLDEINAGKCNFKLNFDMIQEIRYRMYFYRSFTSALLLFC